MPNSGAQEQGCRGDDCPGRVQLNAGQGLLSESSGASQTGDIPLVDKLNGDRIGLVLFAGTSFVQLPITTDYVSAKMFLGNISTESVPVQGTAMGDAINTCIRSFSAQSENSRAIVVITDGENHEDDPLSAAKQAAEMGISVYTIGVGSFSGTAYPDEGRSA